MKYHYIILIALVFAAGCASNETTTTTTTIATVENAVAAGDYVSVDYTGTLANGTVFDSSIGRAPLEFVAGAGQMIKGFDEAVIGMVIGEKKTVRLEPEDAYGEYDESMVIDVPKSNVPEDVEEGDVLYSGGMEVVVLDVGSENVTIDFNHKLAGKALTFEIKILEIAKAS